MEPRFDIPPEREPAAPSTPAPDSLSRSERFITFKLGGSSYAVLAAAVAEVTHPLPVTLLPGHTPGLLGISPLRGEILGVLDVRSIFGEGAGAGSDPKSKQIVLKRVSSDAVPMAFTVDRLGEVAVIGLTQIRPTHQRCAFLIGETEVDGRVIKIIDHSRLPAAAEPDRTETSI